MKIAELIKDKKTIGFLHIRSDSQGGGLNGGVSFSKDGKSFYKEIPLFEEFKKL